MPKVQDHTDEWPRDRLMWVSSEVFPDDPRNMDIVITTVWVWDVPVVRHHNEVGREIVHTGLQLHDAVEYAEIHAKRMFGRRLADLFQWVDQKVMEEHQNLLQPVD